MAEFSKTWTWYKGEWLEGNPPILGPRSHAFWLGSSVFDGGRAFEGVTPDLDLHCERVNRSALSLNLNPTRKTGEILDICHEGIAKFDGETALYVRPMYWGELDGHATVAPDPDATGFCVTIFEAPMLATSGISISLSPFRRPTQECMPVDAKAGCLYPNNARALMEAKERGFDNALVLDMLGHVAELGTANVFMVKDGVVHTPYPNGTFLNGITRQRVISLLKADGYDVHEHSLSYQDCLDADEMFSTGNYSKVTPIVRLDDRNFQRGPVADRVRELYWDFAHS
ncbi:branched-chain amino acid aminotransferase [Coralliovum pocilloporae]|uniref:branched-chain amino acid aminotransferase n=1 Tax=Coralliovum pocilloporae TaxID=3066369 RepID=UPI003306A815